MWTGSRSLPRCALEVSDALDLRVHLPGSVVIEVRGDLIRLASPGQGSRLVVVAFEDLKPSDRIRIERFVATRLAEFKSGKDRWVRSLEDGVSTAGRLYS